MVSWRGDLGMHGVPKRTEKEKDPNARPQTYRAHGLEDSDDEKSDTETACYSPNARSLHVARSIHKPDLGPSDVLPQGRGC